MSILKEALNELPTEKPSLKIDKNNLAIPKGLVKNTDYDFYNDLTFSGEHTGVLTGVEFIDKVMNGIRGVMLVGGQAKAGKTTFVTQMVIGALDQAKQGKVKEKVFVLFYSLELNKRQLNTIILSHISKVNRKKVEKRAKGLFKQAPDGIEITKEDILDGMDEQRLREAENIRSGYDTLFIRSLQDSELPTLKTLEMDLNYIHALARIETEGSQTETPYRILVVIDHLQLLPSPNPIASTIEQENALMNEFLTIRSKPENDKHTAFILITQKRKASMGTPSNDPESVLESVKGSVSLGYIATSILGVDIVQTQVPNGNDVKRHKTVSVSLVDRDSEGFSGELLYFDGGKCKFHYIGTAVDFVGNVPIMPEKPRNETDLNQVEFSAYIESVRAKQKKAQSKPKGAK